MNHNLRFAENTTPEESKKTHTLSRCIHGILGDLAFPFFCHLMSYTTEDL